MKHCIAHSRMQSNNTRIFQLTFINIMQITDVIIVIKLDSSASINTHLFTYLRVANKERK